jgi:signal transduction histidine kinase
VEQQPVDMAAIVAESLDRLNYMIEEYQAEILLPDCWPTALGYGPWIEEVWVNYISNGIKYGGRPPRLQLGATVQGNGTVCCWVRDDGRGLTAEEMNRLFTPFTRLNQISIKGHGLGLSIVRRIVERLGGQVCVDSIPGQGSVFAFTLPAVANHVDNEPAPCPSLCRSRTNQRLDLGYVESVGMMTLG